MRCGEEDPSFTELAGLESHYLSVHGNAASTLSLSSLSKLPPDSEISLSMKIPTVIQDQRKYGKDMT
jgi:hypothetical protein